MLLKKSFFKHLPRHMSKWALNVSQWQLQSAILCLRADPLISSRERVTVALHSACFESTEVIYLQSCLLHGWCHVKLPPSRRRFCVHHIVIHQPVYRVALSKPHTVHVGLTVTCHLHLWQNDQDLFNATAVKRGKRNTKMRAQKVDPGEDISPAALAVDRTRDLSITSPTL